MQTWQSLSKLTLISLWFMAVETAYLSASALSLNSRNNPSECLSLSLNRDVGVHFDGTSKHQIPSPISGNHGNSWVKFSHCCITIYLCSLPCWIIPMSDWYCRWRWYVMILGHNHPVLMEISLKRSFQLFTCWLKSSMDCFVPQLPQNSNVRASSILPITLLTAWSMLSL